MPDPRKIKYTSQEIDNFSFDENFLQQAVLPVATDGTNLLRETSKQVAKKITVSGNDTYVAIAPVGTAQSAAAWQAKKISVSGADTTITWASGGSFNQAATDLTGLTYS